MLLFYWQPTLAGGMNPLWAHHLLCQRKLQFNMTLERSMTIPIPEYEGY